MSQELINRREDLQQLANDGYEVEVRSGYLILNRVPYVTSAREVKYGRLVSTFSVEGPPPDHTVYFAGEYPCDHQGEPIEALRNNSNRHEIAQGLWVDHYFSAKPTGGNYDDFHHKMTHYAQVLARCARRLDPTALATSGSLAIPDDPNDPFVFMETASSRAGIVRISEHLAQDKIGIIGLGGTGSYIFDFVCKTRVAEIHLFDSDQFQQHNAFRSPGTTTIDEIRARQPKTSLLASRYSSMRRRGIVDHGKSISQDNLHLLRGLDFVFVAIHDNKTRSWLLSGLRDIGVPFIDVGMGIERLDDKLLGIVRTSFDEYHQSNAASTGEEAEGDVAEYQRNVQIVELNALNAALAVIRWKKHRGFYVDLEGEGRSMYTIDGNHMSNRARQGVK